MTEDKPIS